MLVVRGKAAANNSRFDQELLMERMCCVDLEKTRMELEAKLQSVRDGHAERVEQLESDVRFL